MLSVITPFVVITLTAMFAWSSSCLLTPSRVLLSSLTVASCWYEWETRMVCTRVLGMRDLGASTFSI